MPRCQRTFRRLGNHADKREIAADRKMLWRCPHCADAEVYEEIADVDLIAYARFAESELVRDFGKPTDASRSYTLFLGLRPECVLEPTDRRYDIYLKRDSDPFQLRLQIGHEMLHRICSQGRIFHWTHEMLACLMSVDLLRRRGLDAYADRVDAAYRSEAAILSFAQMTAADLYASDAASAEDGSGFLAGFYGRAYVTGADLAAAVGFPALCRLPRKVQRDGSPDIKGWLRTLDFRTRELSAPILGITTDNSK